MGILDKNLEFSMIELNDNLGFFLNPPFCVQSSYSLHCRESQSKNDIKESVKLDTLSKRLPTPLKDPVNQSKPPMIGANPAFMASFIFAIKAPTACSIAHTVLFNAPALSISLNRSVTSGSKSPFILSNTQKTKSCILLNADTIGVFCDSGTSMPMKSLYFLENRPVTLSLRVATIFLIAPVAIFDALLISLFISTIRFLDVSIH